jgi:hypothetical protein
MSARAGAASLLDIDPGLGSVLGPLEAAAIGHSLLVPVLEIAPGPWTPPLPSELGPFTVALVVLEGLLQSDTPAPTLAGPLDRLDPWNAETTWTACTSVRVAVIGERFVQAVRPWPGVVLRLLARSGRPVPTRALSGPPEERLLALLWHLAARWGQRELHGIVLPFALGARTLGGLTGLSDAEVAEAFVSLRGSSAAVRRERGGWLLPVSRPSTHAAHRSARRDALRERAAEQLAVARAAQADCNELCRDIGAQLRQTERRRRPRGP